jgi:tryptophan synthase alpha chain
MRYGIDKLARDARAAGVDGCLLTDLSVEEAAAYIDTMRRNHLDTVFLGAPTSTDRRLGLVAKYSSGFVYLVSRTGVTGEQTSVSAGVKPLIDRMRAVTDLPLAVGFGIAKPEHAREVGSVADAVVVGSAIVRIIEKYGEDPQLPATLEAFARELSSALPRRNVAPGVN